MVVAFVALVVAAVIRVVGPFFAATYRPSLFVSGSLWTVAFGVYTVVYLPILVAPRVDGKPG